MPARSRVVHRLAGILALDVVGYGRHMDAGEDRTYRRMSALLDRIVLPAVERTGGRVFSNRGDGLLAEFGSVVGAVECAVLIQQAMQRREATRHDDAAPIQLRIGINFGEVIADGGALYGQGVNLAVRLEGLAEQGGICTTREVAEQIRGTLPLGVRDVGPQQLKHIARPVHVVHLDLPKTRLRGAPARAAAPVPGAAETSSQRPSIAILPFADASGGREDYFAEGLTDAIIRALANWRALPVLSRGSTFAFKGRRAAADLRLIGQDLGAAYVLGGRVQRDAGRVRVATRLVATHSGEHIVAEQYDIEPQDLFEVQDSIARRIVGETAPELLRYERERVMRSRRTNLTSYEHFQRGLWHHYRYTQADAARAQDHLRRALALDPEYCPAAAALAITIIHAVMSDWIGPRAERLAEALGHARTAIALDARDPESHFALGLAEYHLGQVRAALEEMRTAIRLNPSHSAALANQAFLLNYMDRPEEARESVLAAFRLSPFDVRRFIWFTALAGANYLSGRYEEAVEAGRTGLTIKPDYLPTVRYVAAALGQLGRVEEAASYCTLMQRIDTDLQGTEAYLRGYFVEAAALERLMQGLRLACSGCLG